MGGARQLRRRLLPEPAAWIWWSLVVFCALSAAAAAQTTPLTGVELTVPVKRSLHRLQEQWLRWMGDYYQNHPDSAASTLDDVIETARRLGLERLPDLSQAAALRAFESVEDGNFERAEWALAAAERLDPGRPGTAVAAAKISWRRGDRFAAVGHHLVAYGRVFRLPLHRRLWLRNAELWLVLSLLAAAGFFAILQFALRGGRLYLDLCALIGRLVGTPFDHLITLPLLALPLALPNGGLWLLLFWSVLLWGYTSSSERSVLIGGWLLLGLLPIILQRQNEGVSLELSPPVRALESITAGRLYGSLWSDLGVLRTALPDSAPVSQLIADIHRRLGQWEQARAQYRQVLEVEPQNPAALIDLGSYYFRKGDHANAVQLFRLATAAQPAQAEAFYDLSQAFSESYQFDEQKRALTQARGIDNDQVSRWIESPPAERVVAANGGLARIPQIEAELKATWSPPGRPRTLVARGRPFLPFLVGLGCCLLAVSLHLARRSRGYGTAGGAGSTWGSGVLGRVVRVLVPGWAAAEIGSGGRALLIIWIPLALILLPETGSFGYRLPWGIEPGATLSLTVMTAGLLLFFAIRLAVDLRQES